MTNPKKMGIIVPKKQNKRLQKGEIMNLYDWYELWGGEDGKRKSIECPVCACELDEDDDVYVNGREIVGCAFCIDEMTVWDYCEREEKYGSY